MNDRAHPSLQRAALDRLCANAIRFLAIDAVQRANSGHPGAPMGMAEMAVALWQRHLRHDPADPRWPDRDRFVLSNGHASMLLYALLHLSGYELGIDEIERFRQLGSRTPGHPEVGVTPGVETTTGPLGQGLANAVGMALAERVLADEFNREGHRIVDHRTYAFVGDGCLMEGVSHEACALAGALKLSHLVVLYDDNGISIDGEVAAWYVDDTPARFRAYGWNVLGPLDGHDPDAVDAAIALARLAPAPTLIVCRTTIGRGAPTRAGTAKAHGEPLGAAEVEATRQALDWPYGPFEVPDAAREAWDARAEGARRSADWRARFEAYRKDHPLLAAEFERRMRGELPVGFAQRAADMLREFAEDGAAIATRKASQKTIERLVAMLPEMLGGSADLTGSNLTDWAGCLPVRGSRPGGRYVNYGVREFGMAAVMNGVALHGGLLPFGGTFLVFSDYARNAIRMAALMRQRVVHVFTHDSIGLGEDGPTHQPIEQAASLRLVPGLSVWRPCDPAETAVAWLHAVASEGPTALLLTRQALPAQPRSGAQREAIRRGGYILSDAPSVRAVIIATGSEVAIAVAAQERLAERGVAVRVVSMPSTDVFDAQPAAWRDAVLPSALPRVVVEAGVPDGWWRFAGEHGRVIGISRFGESAPAGALFAHFGLTAERVADEVLGLLADSVPAGV